MVEEWELVVFSHGEKRVNGIEHEGKRGSEGRQVGVNRVGMSEKKWMPSTGAVNKYQRVRV